MKLLANNYLRLEATGIVVNGESSTLTPDRMTSNILKEVTQFSDRIDIDFNEAKTVNYFAIKTSSSRIAISGGSTTDRNEYFQEIDGLEANVLIAAKLTSAQTYRYWRIRDVEELEPVPSGTYYTSNTDQNISSPNGTIDVDGERAYLTTTDRDLTDPGIYNGSTPANLIPVDQSGGFTIKRLHVYFNNNTWWQSPNNPTVGATSSFSRGTTTSDAGNITITNDRSAGDTSMTWGTFANLGTHGVADGLKTFQFVAGGGSFEYYYHESAWTTAFQGESCYNVPIVIAQSGSVYKTSIAPANLVVTRDGDVGPAGGGVETPYINNTPFWAAGSETILTFGQTSAEDMWETFITATPLDKSSWVGIGSGVTALSQLAFRWTESGVAATDFLNSSFNGLLRFYMPTTDPRDNLGGYFDYYYHEAAWRYAFEGLTSFDAIIALDGSVFKATEGQAQSELTAYDMVVRGDGAVGFAGGGSAIPTGTNSTKAAKINYAYLGKALNLPYIAPRQVPQINTTDLFQFSAAGTVYPTAGVKYKTLELDYPLPSYDQFKALDDYLETTDRVNANIILQFEDKTDQFPPFFGVIQSPGYLSRRDRFTYWPFTLSFREVK